MTRARSTDLSDIARLVAIAGGNIVQASYIAQSTRAPDAVRAVLKAAVDAGTTTDADWAKPLAEHGDAVAAFVESLRSRSVFARMLDGGMVRMPLRTKGAIVTANATAWSTGEGMPIPVGALSLAGPALEERKAAGLVIVTNELLRSTSPAGRALLDASLKGAVADAIDAGFVGIIADGVTPASGSGATAADALTDLRGMLGAVNLSAGGALFWLSSVDVANRATTLSAANGGLLFPAMSPLGGEMLNLPALVSNAVPAGSLMLVDATGVAAEIETISIALSDQASLQMDTAPASPPNASAVLRSLWQENKIALLVRVFYGAEVIRVGSVAVLSDVAWGVAA